MRKRYSTYEAKARITHRGRPVAEVRRVDESAGSLSDRLDALERSGIFTGPVGKSAFKPLARKAGALKRFLKSRE